jgi:integrase
MITQHSHRRESVPYLPLRGMSLAPTTQTAYSKQLGSFLSHARLDLRSFLVARASVVDRALAVYIQACYDARSSFAYVSQALSGAVHQRPDLRHRLPIARQCLRGWDKVRETTSHPPLTWELTVVMACTLARSGYHGAAIAMLLAFDCFLRVGELTRIRFTDIVMPNDPRTGRAHSTMAVVLRAAKTGKLQSVEVADHDVARLVALWARSPLVHTDSTDPDPRLFAFSPDFLRRLMYNASVALQLPTRYTPHSLRHGGATDDFLRHGSVERVQFRGRWKQLESVRRYVQMARAVLSRRQVPPHVHRFGVALSGDLVSVLTHLLRTVPPVVTRAYSGRRVTFHLSAPPLKGSTRQVA